MLSDYTHLHSCMAMRNMEKVHNSHHLNFVNNNNTRNKSTEELNRLLKHDMTTHLYPTGHVHKYEFVDGTFVHVPV